MFTLLALSTALTASDPALAGAPLEVPPPPTGTVVIETPCPPGARRAEDCRHRAQSTYRSHTASQYRASMHAERVRSDAQGQRTVSTYSEHTASSRRTVTLSDGFFLGGLTGGVEGRHTTYYGHGHRVIIVGGSHAPVSAGQAAAARGLGRASH